MLWGPVCSLQDGVVKLEETGRFVKGLKRELTQLQPLLESKAFEAEGLLKQVRSGVIRSLGSRARGYPFAWIACYQYVRAIEAIITEERCFLALCFRKIFLFFLWLFPIFLEKKREIRKKLSDKNDP